MLRPTTPTIAPLDGLRALSILGVIAAHTPVLMAVPLGMSGFIQTLRSKAGLFAMALSDGDCAMPTFFVLSGFLITELLLRERAAKGTISLPRFYLSRALRLLPAYYVALLLYAVAGDAMKGQALDTQSAWTYLVYLNNYIRPRDATALMDHAWSLAVEEHFYFVLPVAILVLYRVSRIEQGRTRLAIVGLGIALAIVVRGAIFWAHRDDFWKMSLDRRFELLYFPTHARFGELLCGVAASLAIQGTGVLRWLREHPRTARAVAAFALLACLALTVGTTFTKSPRGGGFSRGIGTTLFIALQWPGFALCVAYLLVFVISDRSRRHLLTRFLSWPVWYPIAQLTYATYLLHWLVIGKVYKWTLTSPPTTPATLFALLVMNVLVVLAAGIPLHLFVERPLMRLRRVLLR